MISFAFFFVPLLVALCLARVPSCQRSAPLPIRRAAELLLASRLTLLIIGATLFGEWVSVGLEVHRQAWSSVTAVLVGVLCLMTLGTAIAAIQVRLAFRHIAIGTTDGPEWWADVLGVLEGFCYHLGGAGRAAQRFLYFFDRWVVGAVRGHPVRGALVASVPFALAIAALQGQEQAGTAWRPLLLFATVSGCSMFAFLLLAGSHLRLVEGSRALRGDARRAIDATVAAAASIPATLSFRAQLRGVLDGLAGGKSGHLFQAGLVLAAGIGALVYAIEMWFRTHD